MDVANLTSARTDRAHFDGAAQALPAAVPGVPAAPLASAPLDAGAAAGGDRIERSEELARSVLEQQEALARLAPPSQERIDEYRAGLADADSVARSSLETAASGLLRGELFFTAGAPGA